MSLKNELLKFCKHRVAPQVFIACCKEIYIYITLKFLLVRRVQPTTMMHMFKNPSTVNDYNHSEVDGDARNRMKRHRKLQGRRASAAGDDVQAPQSARCKSSNPPQCRASGRMRQCSTHQRNVRKPFLHGRALRPCRWPSCRTPEEIDDSDVFAIVHSYVHFSGSQHCSTKTQETVDGDGRRIAKPTLYEMWEHWLSHVSDGAVLNRGGSMSDLETLRLIRGRESLDIPCSSRPRHDSDLGCGFAVRWTKVRDTGWWWRSEPSYGGNGNVDDHFRNCHRSGRHVTYIIRTGCFLILHIQFKSG
jgi:hypothetical protein